MAHNVGQFEHWDWGSVSIWSVNIKSMFFCLVLEALNAPISGQTRRNTK